MLILDLNKFTANDNVPIQQDLEKKGLVSIICVFALSVQDLFALDHR